MSLTRERAWQQLCEWTETDTLRKHARAVEVVMRAAAHRYGAGAADVEAWGIAGMLHDADYEKWPEELCAQVAIEPVEKHRVADPHDARDEVRPSKDEVEQLVDRHGGREHKLRP
jgi:predicted hydrolase (HD superfamily)